VSSGALGRAGRSSVAVVVLLVAALVLVVLPAPGGTRGRVASAAPGGGADGGSAVDVRPDATDGGRVFDGIGAVSGGGNTSRLLQDYPSTQQRQVLDYLFRPDYGASLQLLKVEIGADTDSTEGAEPSVERAPGQVSCNADPNWAMIRAAKIRNPAIKIAALEWGAPGWLRGGFWSQDNIDYLLTWLGCAKAQGFTVDYLGGWNERGYRPDWFAALGAAVARSYPRTRIIAADSFGWSIAADLRRDPAFDRAVSVVGVHHPCRPAWQISACPSPAEAQSLHQPLWASEESAQDFTDGAQPLARELNANYLDGRMTGAFVWSAVSAFYDDLPLAGRGLVLAEQPWSGAYAVGRDVWVVAQTTQFAAPGWRYQDSASGRLPLGGSYVTLRAPGSPSDWSTVVETTQASGPQRLRFAPGAGMRPGPLHEWCTDLDSTDPARWFARQPDPEPAPGGTTLTVAPDSVCSVTTTTGQHRGSTNPPAAGRMPLPYTADTSGPDGTNPPLFFDVNGAFDTTPCGGGRSGTCIGQVVARQPIPWSSAGTGVPTTLVGDPTWPGDYSVSTSVLLQRAPWVELLGRVDGARGQAVSGYALRLSADGRWQLDTDSAVRLLSRGDIGEGVAGQRVLASGRVAARAGWRQLALRMTGDRITAVLDGQVLTSLRDGTHTDGQVGLRVGGWDGAQFAGLQVTPTAPAPRLVPASDLVVSASSELYDEHDDVDGRARRVLDGRPATEWTSAGPVDEEHPATLTLTLRSPRRVGALTVTPPRNGTLTGMVTSWRVETSTDGTTFAPATVGSWSPGTDLHTVRLDTRTPIRAVRLVITGSVGSDAAVAELGLVAAPAA
jgi:Glycosyl hydrolase family 59/F5/8 type C domain/Galactocerebrosidase, C-terminal lectin domain